MKQFIARLEPVDFAGTFFSDRDLVEACYIVKNLIADRILGQTQHITSS